MATLNRAIRALEQAEAKIVALEQRRDEPIAVVGLGCRFPQGRSPELFWHSLDSGVDAVSEIPASRWPVEPSLRKARWAALLDDDDVAGFDAGFFGVSPREAAAIDPQQRLVLEVAVEALEDAGIPLEAVRGARAGVFIGMMTLDYQQLSMELPPDQLDIYTSTGIGACFGSGRLSHVLGLEGPSVSTDTACSSSLVALHLACQSLRARECHLALAGGANLMLSPWTMRLFVQMQALSPEGRCRTFDARSNGFVRGEGCGVIVLKRLSDALHDGDSIRALIRGSAVNHNGRSSGLTAPSVLSQQALLRQALTAAQVDPQDIGYVEAHGIATPLGDPIEIEALKAVLGAPRPDGSSCAIGSVKTNVGHLEAAAGIAGVIKTILALEHERIPPHLHLDALNPRISLEGTALAITGAGRAWPRGDRPRRAGVSAFGLSGANAHVVLEEAPAPGRPEAANREATARPGVMLVTARSEASLRRLAERYAETLEQATAPSVEDLAYTTIVGRSHHPHRLAVIGTSPGELAAGLRRWLSGAPAPNLRAGHASSAVVHVADGVHAGFTGQDPVPVNGGNGLAEPDPRTALASLAEVFVAGGAVDWAAGGQTRGRLARLPTYAWDLERHWIRRTGPAPAVAPGARADAVTAAAITPPGELDRRASPLLVQTWRPREHDPAAASRPAPAGRWLIVSAGDRADRAAQLTSSLRAAGHHVTTWPWEGGDDTAANEAALAAALGAAFAGDDARGIVVYGRSLPALTGEASGATLQAAVEQACWEVMQLAEVTARWRWKRSPPRLWLITEAAQDVAAGAHAHERALAEPGAHAADASLPGAALWGLGRTIGLEHPELRCSRLDVEPTSDPALIAAELARDAADEELGLRDTSWHVGSLERIALDPIHRLPGRPSPARREPAQGRPFRLELDRAGILDQLTFRVAPVSPPGAGQVRVRVLSAGLNFMDVMTALGIYPGIEPAPGAPAGGREPIVLGGECSGQIDAVGPGVTGFAVGDPVVAVGRGCFGSYLTTDAAYVQPRPPALDATLAGGVPIVFLTAWYALVTLGRLQAGERILIHSAATGVGLAAVQIARWLGAEIHATAGTDDKRALLRQLGVATVMDSRSQAFAAELLAATGGEGVDMVLNSLSGASIEASLAAMASDGRFFEIGKTDIYAGGRALGLSPFRRRLSYQAVDLLGLAQDRKARFAVLFAEVMAAFGSGLLQPLPTTLCGAAGTTDAFRQMASGRHTGKLVVAIEGSEVLVEPPVAPLVEPRASYLVTGGPGALGLSVTEWLVAQGARRIVWISRRGLAGAPASHAARVAALGAQGVELRVCAGDVSRADDVAAAVREAEAMGPLRGMVHAAGVPEAAAIGAAGKAPDRARLSAVMAPKVAGAWNVHCATARAPLDFFVMFSSASALLGAPGRAGDAAANAFLDGLARERRRRGQVALSLQWGPFAAEAGRGGVGAGGVHGLDPREGWQTLGGLLAAAPDQIGEAGVIRFHARQLIEYYPHLASGTRFLPLLAGGDAPLAGGDRALLDQFARAGAAERATLLDQLIRQQLAELLGRSAGDLEPETPFKALGVDSLQGLELRNRLEAALGIPLSAALIWAYPDLRSLGEYLLGRLILGAAPRGPAPDAPDAPGSHGALPAADAPPAADLRSLSDDPHAALLEQELASIERLLHS